jgi:hypothetical protein
MVRAQAGAAAQSVDVAGELASGAAAPSMARRLRWIALAFVPSSLMLGVTTYVTTDVAAIPLLWVIPLALYLLSFILVFAQWPPLIDKLLATAIAVGLVLFLTTFFIPSEVFGTPPERDLASLGPYSGLLAPVCGTLLVMLILACWPAVPPLLHRMLVVLLPIVALAVAFPPPYDFDWFGRLVHVRAFVWQSVLLHFLGLFVAAMVCHGELARTRPTPQHLTEFYLCMSIGGVLGGLCNALIAPVSFDKVVEYPLVIALACLLLPRLGIAATSRPVFRLLDLGLTGLLGLFGLGLAIALLGQAFLTPDMVSWLPSWLRAPITEAFRDSPRWQGVRTLHQERNFFGLVRVNEYEHNDRTYHYMVHGTTDHGMQCVEPPERRADPISYFHRKGPVGQIFQALHAKQKPAIHMAVLGVGTGTLAGYAEKDWSVSFYEIDAAVVRLARNPRYFTFLPDCEARGARMEVNMGDGRLQLGKARPSGFDVLFMDAFTSDAVPVHLITREAIELYKEKLAPDGILVVNIANRYIDFKPVLGNLAKATGLEAMVAADSGDRKNDRYGSVWVVMARNREAFGSLVGATREEGDDRGKPWFEPLPPEPGGGVGVWTDDYSNILRVFNWQALDWRH